MKKTHLVRPLLAFASFFALHPAVAAAQNPDDDEVIGSETDSPEAEDNLDDEEIVANDLDDDEVVGSENDAPEAEDSPDAEEIVANDADDEEIVADDEEIVADDEEGVAAGGEKEVPDGDEGRAVGDEEVVGSSDDEVSLEAEFAPGEEPYRAPPAGRGVIWGRLQDVADGEPALEAQVKVRETGTEVFTDYDGYYRLELPPGSYTLEIFYELYEASTLSNVVVTAGSVVRVDERLRPRPGAVDEEIIEDDAETQTIEGLALARQRSVSQGDAIGREEISKGTDSNAAEAAQRVVGANIVGGRFVYVRGLGERYTNSLLGGVPLPSPEPDKAAVPLNVFPASVLDSLTIVKTFTPDMPADFAGGSVQIETRSVPTEPLFQVAVKGGFNSQATGRHRLNEGGSSTDFLGFDNGERKLPDTIPTGQRVVGDNIDPNSELSPGQVTQIGKQINSPMSATPKGTPIEHGASVVAGNTWVLKNGHRIGVLASANYNRKYEVYRDAVVKEYWVNLSDPRGFQERLDYRVTSGVEQVRWGAFGKLSYLPSDNHKITLNGLHSQLSDKWANEYRGTNIQSASNYVATQLGWVERGMSFGVLSGRHDFPELKDAHLGWDASVSSAFRNEPDRRDTVYQRSDRLSVDPSDRRSQRAPGWFYLDGDESGRHFWSHQNEVSYGGKMDWTQPLLHEDLDEHHLNVKFGGLVNLKERDFWARRLILRPSGAATSDSTYYCLGREYQRECPDKLFQDQSIPRYLNAQENPQAGDFYKANLYVYAAYAMLDWAPSEMLRLVGGARVEITDQGVEPLDPLDTGDTLFGADLTAVDILPAISAVVSPTKKMKTRLSYARTLARPQVRELAPFGFSDYFGGRVVTGNPDLVLTSIDNFDVRVEFWPSLTEIVAMSVFYKYLRNPIEQTLIPADTAPQVTFINAKKANVIGLELELRKNLGFLTDALADLAVNTNFTVTHSRTEVPQTGTLTITNPSRPLVNQAPWVVNVALDYDNPDSGTSARLAYNINAPTLVEVGTDTIPDGYLQPFHSLDFSVGQKFFDHFRATFAVENIVNDNKIRTQGKQLNRDSNGHVEVDNVLSMYKYGRTFQLTVGYEL